MEKLEIPQTVREGLTLLGRDLQVSAEGFELLLEGIVQKALNVRQAELKIATVIDSLQRENVLQPVDWETLANHVGNLATFTSICARQGAQEDAVRDYITKCGWGTTFADAYVKHYVQSLPKMKAYLAAISSQGSKLVNVNWRLDLQHKNGQLGVTNTINYLVEFQLEKDGQREALHFSATKPELEDLVFVLRNASHCIRRVAS